MRALWTHREAWVAPPALCRGARVRLGRRGVAALRRSRPNGPVCARIRHAHARAQLEARQVRRQLRGGRRVTRRYACVAAGGARLRSRLGGDVHEKRGLSSGAGRHGVQERVVEDAPGAAQQRGVQRRWCGAWRGRSSRARQRSSAKSARLARQCTRRLGRAAAAARRSSPAPARRGDSAAAGGERRRRRPALLATRRGASAAKGARLKIREHVSALQPQHAAPLQRRRRAQPSGRASSGADAATRSMTQCHHAAQRKGTHAVMQ